MLREKIRYLSLVTSLAIGLTSLATAPSNAGSGAFFAGGTEYRVPVQSMRERKFNGVVAQQYDFSCGSAAVATLLTYHYDRPVTERDVFLKMYEVGDQERIQQLGFSLLDMKLYLESIGLRADGFRVDLERIEETGVPLIALVNIRGYKHFVVIKGVSRETVLLGDPAVGKRVISRTDFLDIWDGVAFVIRNEGARGRLNWNKQDDWSGFISAPISSTALNNQTLHSFTSSLAAQVSPDDFR